MNINNLIAGTYEHRSRDVSVRKLLNCMPEASPDGVVPAIIIGTPAQKIAVDLSATLSGQGCRGLYFTSTSQFFAMLGGTLIEVLPNNTTIVRYTTTYTPSPVSMTDDGLNLLIVDGAKMLQMNLTTNVITETLLDFDKPTKVVFANNRAVCINQDDTLGADENSFTRRWNRFYFSELRDFANIPALNFYTTEQSADKIVSIEVRDADIWLFGERSYEIWRGQNDADNPFFYAGGADVNIGCGAPNSVASIASRIFFLGNSTNGVNHIYMTEGFGVVDITTSAISAFLSQNNALTKDAIGYCYTQETHTFYCLTFNQLDRTFVYDLTTGKWHERSTRDALLNVHHKWRAQYSTYAFGQVYVGDLSTACLYTLEMDKFYDDIDGGKTLPIVRILQSPTITDEAGRELFLNNVNIFCETGNSLQIGQGSDAKLMCQLSTDSGYSWGSEVQLSLGKLGQYNHRVQRRRCGRSSAWVLRLTMSDPVRFLMMAIDLDIDVALGRSQ